MLPLPTVADVIHNITVAPAGSPVVQNQFTLKIGANAPPPGVLASIYFGVASQPLHAQVSLTDAFAGTVSVEPFPDATNAGATGTELDFFTYLAYTNGQASTVGRVYLNYINFDLDLPTATVINAMK